MDVKFFWLVLLLSVILYSCSGEQKKQSASSTVLPVHRDSVTTDIFSKLPPSTTGITFANVVRPDLDINVLNYAFMYNGGGVGIGDINNDGRPDILFTGNMVSSRLYLNKGDMQFEDITDSAGLRTEGWITGVSMVDINNDGFLDLYLSRVSREDDPPRARTNLLYINNGDITFTEQATAYNLDDTSFTTQAAFLDYNRDGYLDLYLLNHSPGSFSRDMGRGGGGSGPLSSSFDKLYKNNGDGTFVDVSRRAGILRETGYGLGVAVGDLNRDGWPDIYVSNDIAPDDVLYINNRDGTFTDRSSDYLKHTSYAGMGVDVSDFNNDGWPDILQADMMPSDYQERKLMSYGVDYQQYQSKINQGYHYSYTKNTLQMSNGINQEGEIIFSEVSRMAGVAYTGWSWASLFGDYDNDGYKDIFITNGYPVAVNDFDYLVDQAQSTSLTDEEEYRRVMNIRKLKLPNYLFRNSDGIRFADVSAEWGFSDSTYSYGTAHGDLDNDGDLDLVINNLNAPAGIYENKIDEQGTKHYLRVGLNGSPNNRQGIGTNVVLHAAGEKQFRYLSPYRGYQSSVEPEMHFGLANNEQIDSLEVFWPDGKYQVLTDIEPNQQLNVDYNKGKNSNNTPKPKPARDRNFQEITEEVGLQYHHRENTFNDYDIQPTLHRQLSRMGPKTAAGDVTGNGLDDLYIGGASGFPGVLYLQDDNGKFEAANQNQPWLNDAYSEDMGAIFFDANGDGHMDLYVASGGYEFSPAEDGIQDRLYLNRGDGQFYKSESALPQMLTSSSMVRAGDFNGDGQKDLFVCGRLTPLKYPNGARSYILKNEGGKFTDVTEQIAPELAEPALRTDAEWIDFNGDGQLDLVTTGIWQPVEFYENDDGIFNNVTEQVVELSQTGWWYSLEKGDFNNDGVPDLAAGNLGWNHTFTTSDTHKFGLYASDFDQDYTQDLMYVIDEGDKSYPFFGKARLGWAISTIGEKYPTFRSFSGVPMEEIFEPHILGQAQRYQADTFASSFFLSEEAGKYSVQELPIEAQIAPIKGITAYDVDQDDNQDLVIAGNIFSTHPDISRADGGNGLWLKGDGNGEFEPVSPFNSGFIASDNVKDLKLIRTPRGKALLVANNGGPIQVFYIN